MKLDQLRKIIREEVRAAVKEELQDVINEAVKIASTPTIKESSVIGKDTKVKELAEMTGFKPPISKNATIDEMLNHTAKTMTSDEYKNIFAGTSDMVQKPFFNSNLIADTAFGTSASPSVGIDITQLDFVAKAKSVFDLSKKKDKLRTN
jgi:hypothetical protein